MRRPKAVKKLTAAGKTVRITDNGQPLWLVAPDHGADADDNAEARARSWEEHYGDLLKQPRGKPILPSLSQVILEERGKR